ncbi:Glycine cleavage system transcriptional activator [Pigmentiphaga humi]|uniref:Glycine cleavage system transcriptional activator n=1 Tax=Pigmentiphaga humi TaxID=2478468 RepID=A0A3P4AYG2_9BURK|nr:LysR substrate-binding domain-containing protein [Pigmentiphaga humi]VCU69087.1 Glycine cleavage system transcriptional activator [Pigmentiphaga humi]
MRRLPPLNSLKAFEAVARLGSVVRAAEELCVSHGAVSKQVLNLERWLGAALFERRGRQLEPTAAGRVLAGDLRDLFDRLAGAVERACPETGRKLVISAPPTMTLHWLLPRLTGFLRLHPHIEIQLNNRRDRAHALPGGVDAAIRRGRSGEPDLIETAFMKEAVTPLWARGGRARPACFEELAQQTWLTADMRPDDWQRWLAVAGAPHLQPQARLGFDHTYLAVEAALDGLGVAMGPRYLMQEELEAGRLEALFPDVLAPADDYFFVRERHRADDPALEALNAWLQSQGREHEARIAAAR